MAGQRPHKPNHQLPVIQPVISHPSIAAKAAGNCQIDGAASVAAVSSRPATTRIGSTLDGYQITPGIKTKPTPPFSAVLDVRVAGSPSRPDSQLPDGSSSIPATSGGTTVADPQLSTPGIMAISKDPSIAPIGVDLQNPQSTEVRVFSSTNPSNRQVQAKIGKNELHNCDARVQASRLVLASSVSAPVNFPATAAGAPPATAAPATGKNPAAPVFPTDSKTHPPSLAQVVSASKRISIPTFVTEPLPDRGVTVHRGMPAVRFNESEVSDLALIDKYILVGKFSHGQPKLEVIKNHLATNYVFRGTISVGWRDSKHVFILFSNSHDCSTMLLEGTLFFNGDYPMRLFRWTPDFDPEVETSLAPAWILFYGLPLHMFNFHALSLICKPIGKLLGVDKVTLAREKPHVARVCVEVDLLKPLLKEIFVGTSEVVGNEDCGFAQSVVYERLPYYCEYCWRQGHSLDRCKLKAQDSKSEAQNLPKTQPQAPLPKPKTLSKPTAQVSLPKHNSHIYIPKAQKPNTQAPPRNPTPSAQTPTPTAQNPTAQNPPLQNPPVTPSSQKPISQPNPKPKTPAQNPSAQTLNPFAQAFPGPKPKTPFPTPSSALNPKPKTPPMTPTSTRAPSHSAITRTPQPNTLSPNLPAQHPNPAIPTPVSSPLGLSDWQVKTRKGSRSATEGELDVLEVPVSVPESSVLRSGERFHVHRLYEGSSFLEDFFDPPSPLAASPDIDLGKGKGKAPCTPPMLCTLNRSPDTIPLNMDFGITKSARSRFLEPGPSRSGGGWDSDDDYPSEGETSESEDEWARPYDPLAYMETFERELDLVMESPPRITLRTRHRRLYDSS